MARLHPPCTERRLIQAPQPCVAARPQRERLQVKSRVAEVAQHKRLHVASKHVS